MSCCSPADVRLEIEVARSVASEELFFASRDLGDGTRQTDLSVPGMHCGACIAAVEKKLSALDGVANARVNLSTRRVAVRWRPVDGAAPDLIGTLGKIGYPAHLFSFDADAKDPELSRLLKALAVAGFCAMNIMLLSVSVWSGATGQTRQAFHFLSAALALPAILYSGRIFYLSAWSALRHLRTNMDVPISIGVTLAFALSLYDTMHGAPYAYFDAATTLLFFLLIGRTLDHMMREKARSAVAGLARLAPIGATVVETDGTRRYVATTMIEPGTTLFIAPGDRIPVDGVVETGNSELDCSLVSGESAPFAASAGTALRAGLMNLTGPLTMKATARAEDSFLAEMVRMMEAAEGGRASYRRLADRAAALYSPVVHTIALLSLVGWLFASGDWHRSIAVAISVLIVTCPCALGLAVPIVQVVAARCLFELGIMVKDGSALERLAEADTVLFDKTGVLTLGKPVLANAAEIAPAALGIAAAIAVGSRHPSATAIAAAGVGRPAQPFAFDDVKEIPGLGLEAWAQGAVYRLGRHDWATGHSAQDEQNSASVTVLTKDGEWLATFLIEDDIRPGAEQVVRALKSAGLQVGIVSGDRRQPVQMLARRFDIDQVEAELLPAGKLVRIEELAGCGSRVLMVGDGLNDGPALAAAHVSMAPSTAVDIGRNAADFVFLAESLSAVTQALGISKRAGKLIRQNFALAVAYNALAVPIAVAGYVTPLLAALAMSMSSLLVVANAMRLRPNVPTAPVTRPRLSTSMHVAAGR
ncbi:MULTISPECIES: heavy metal translocating P-type ATPase [unclassified Mesorhizobium]|uniref:heavy metal translocating P-type ATPase n=1 Tax=unclassified Mesorhizobium TaxID=325217 RepID=UPI0010935CED|nr:MULTISPECIES: heavy metal translocating P-type ATPase [unclassified Mesorhizobium]TGQ72994.1 cadmium-translocating P-type ATPase [bacterium M00.F.Ca.ET.205.01.1.1]TGU53750.1 cadmium-translocating P-type ATPase [bacterium M00.F.Ca.ET.152.01.1.1]TGV37250.1 cadmium-translocating P-type ATPase [Mesorhizobium sp. M00.F.Ca.ET.186.01.1.1]TGZ39381.1 cadmium-translocating P-type ATPase [bacterium M00.F.Ca.ET.162.01.1.1]TGT92161.1 cadmium-translocating P-type ATPase [Mesorhizobium sp. M8A.F.Ca.ET.161